MHRWEVWNGTAWKHTSEVFCDIDLSQHILGDVAAKAAKAATTPAAAAATTTTGHDDVTVTTRDNITTAATTITTTNNSDNDDVVAIYDLGPVDVYVHVVPSDQTVTLSLSG